MKKQAFSINKQLQDMITSLQKIMAQNQQKHNNTNPKYNKVQTVKQIETSYLMKTCPNNKNYNLCEIYDKLTKDIKEGRFDEYVKQIFKELEKELEQQNTQRLKRALHERLLNFIKPLRPGKEADQLLDIAIAQEKIQHEYLYEGIRLFLGQFRMSEEIRTTLIKYFNMKATHDLFQKTYKKVKNDKNLKVMDIKKFLPKDLTIENKYHSGHIALMKSSPLIINDVIFEYKDILECYEEKIFKPCGLSLHNQNKDDSYNNYNCNNPPSNTPAAFASDEQQQEQYITNNQLNSQQGI